MTSPSPTDDNFDTTSAYTAGAEKPPGHVMPWQVLVAVWLGLVILTAVTVAVTFVDTGGFNVWLALAIATAKASLVALYFMHLRYDSPFNAIVLIAALLFAMMFISITLMDVSAYQETFEVPAGIKPPPS